MTSAVLRLNEYFEEYAGANPDKVALIIPCKDDVENVGKQRCISYNSLNYAASQLAANIRNILNTNSYDENQIVSVGVCCHEGELNILGLYAAMKAGVPYVPIDPTAVDRLRYIITDSNVQIILSDDKIIDSMFFDGRVKDLPVINTTPFLAEQPAPPDFSTNEWNAVQMNRSSSEKKDYCSEIAYIVYTSGSTGMPKGVIGSHRAMINRFEWMYNRYPFQPEDRCCHKTSLGFVDHVFEILGSLGRGATLVKITHIYTPIYLYICNFINNIHS